MTIKNSACPPFAVCSNTHGAILLSAAFLSLAVGWLNGRKGVPAKLSHASNTPAEQKVTGGSRKTAELDDKHGKPWVYLPGRQSDPASRLLAFIAEGGICTLNIAGTRAPKEPDIYRLVKRTLEDAFFPQPTRESGDSG